MHDVIVVGGSYAGISAALQLGRARRRVLVIDAGQRRNRFAAHSHGFLGQDGRDPAVIAATARAELLAYRTVTWLESAATDARVIDGGSFSVTVASGACHEAKRLVLAGGVVDELPDIPGVADRWGRTVFHCPYCHGYELENGRIGVIATSPLSAHVAQMLPDWGTTTYFTRGLFEPTEEEQAAFVRRGVAIDRARVLTVTGGAHDVTVQLADGRSESFAGLFVMPKTRVAGPLAAQLGCALENGPTGQFVQTDLMRETSVRGVFACGDAAMAAGSVALAVGDGVRAGVSAHQSLVFR
jgi:thioredoxin reductase